jgi:hypothetical protein
LASTGRGGIAFAHQKLGGRFIYLANDDGDMGTLPVLSQQAMINPSDNSNRWFVWEKSGDGIPVDLNRKRKGSNLSLRIHVGPLPDPIPSSWVAYEPETHLSSVEKERDEFTLPFFKPNDTDSFVGRAWWSTSLGVEEAWKLVDEAGLKAEPVRMAVIDTGAVGSHPGLQPQLYQSTDILNGKDDDDNGFVDDYSGYDFVLENSSIVDFFGHGTHVSGLMVGYDPTNGVLAPAAKNGKLIVLRSLDRSGKSTSIELARALYYAIQAKVKVINCSWGGGGVTEALKDAFEAVRKNNILVFSSSGNDATNTDPPNNQPVPKLFPGVISVGATTQSGGLGSYSNWGKTTVRYLAPGDKILSTTKDSGFGELSGTSMASPIAVSTYTWLFGVAKAKCKRDFCDRNDLQLREIVLEIMCQTANARGVETRSSCGIINMLAATQTLLSLQW